MLETINNFETDINLYINESNWKVWVIYKEDIKYKSLKLKLESYNELMEYIFKIKENVKGENKMKIFELRAMLSNNKIYIKK